MESVGKSSKNDAKSIKRYLNAMINTPIPLVIRTLCAELAYIAMYRVRHSTDSTAPDPFMYITQRHNQIFTDIHARRLCLSNEEHTLDVPLVVGDNKKLKLGAERNKLLRRRR